MEGQLTLSLVLPPAGLVLRFWKGGTYLLKDQPNKAACEIKLPQAIVETLPASSSRKYGNTMTANKGQRELAE